jgi:hypothetical protein
VPVYCKGSRSNVIDSLRQSVSGEIEHPPYSPNLAQQVFWLFPKIKSALKGQRFQDNEDTLPPKKRNYEDGTESYSKTGVPKMFPTWQHR